MEAPFVFSYFLVIFSLIVLGSIYFCSKRICGIWFNPASLFSLAWLVLILIPLLAIVDEQINPAGVLYIISFVICFSISIALFPWDRAIEMNRKKVALSECFSESFLSGIFYCAVLSGLLFHYFDLLKQGISLSNGILAIAAEYADKRYTLNLDDNVFSKLALLASFQAVVFGGFVFGFRKSPAGKMLVVLVALLPSLFVMIFQSAKGLAFLSAAMMIGAWLVTRIFKNDYRAPQIRIGPAVVVVSLGFVAVIFSFLARVGDDTDLVFFYLSSYSSGHLFAFLDWFSDRYFDASRFSGYTQPQLQAGFFTFMGVFKAFGDLREVPLGIYDEIYEIPGVLMTNIYTVFRGLISDFGLFGSLFFGLVAGILANATFFVMLWNRFSVLAIVTFIYMIGMIYQSYVVSSLTWISIPASALISMLLLLVIKRSTLSQIERLNRLTMCKAAV